MADALLWFRRDLRMDDHPALLAAHEDGRVLPLYVLDPRLLAAAGPARRNRLLASLGALHRATDGALVVRTGRPQDVVPRVAAGARAQRVHVSGESTPFGRRRDERVRERLRADGRQLVATGTPYAVGPGTLLTGAGTAYQVFTRFARAWRRHGWPEPAPLPAGLRWVTGHSLEEVPQPFGEQDRDDDQAGEAAARRHWRRFVEERLDRYDTERDRPDLDSTSRMSAALKYGEAHPRTLLAALGGRRDQAAQRFVTELAWREFYADVLWHQPRSAWADLRPGLARMAYDEPAEGFAAWQGGRTGFPLVDAGMRQLLAEGWMHNRVRMVTASFLTKDLHVWWPHGARHFLDRLRDGDLASNSHGWQWVAGTGTDAAPYFRIFNPVTQGRSVDPEGDYVRRWVPELRHLPGRAAHEPWTAAAGYAQGYPERILDHAEEREEALRRYRAATTVLS